MAKYKVGDELLIINDPSEENEKLKSLTKLDIISPKEKVYKFLCDNLNK